VREREIERERERESKRDGVCVCGGVLASHTCTSIHTSTRSAS